MRNTIEEVKRPLSLSFLFGVLFFHLAAAQAFAAEKILRFDSQITVHEDATMTVR